MGRKKKEKSSRRRCGIEINGSKVAVEGPLMLSGTVSCDIIVAASLLVPYASLSLLFLLQLLYSVTMGQKQPSYIIKG